MHVIYNLPYTIQVITKGVLYPSISIFMGDFPIRAYGAMLALAIICGASVAYVFIKKMVNSWHEHIIDFSITVAIACLIGARLWDVFFFDWQYYGNHYVEIPFVWQGGMAIQGGLFLAPLQATGTYVKTISISGPLLIYLPAIRFWLNL